LWRIPKKFALVSASAEGPFELVALDNALRKAGVGELNLIPVSSILPKGCVLSDLPSLQPGTLTPVVMAKICSSTPGQKIAAALGVAISEDSHGMISEYHDIGVTEKTAGKTAEAMVRYMMEERDLKPTKVISVSAGHTVRHHGAAVAIAVFLP